MLLRISGADIDSVTFKERCRSRNPNLLSPEPYPACLPHQTSDGEDSLLSHPLTPLDRSPEVHQYEQPKVIPGGKSVPSVRDLLQQAVDKSELLISEGTAQEVPATDLRATASPTYNPLLPKPRGSGIWTENIIMEALPVLKPALKLCSHATDPVPGPTFTLNSFGKVELVQSPRSVQSIMQSQLTAEDEEALKWVGWPVMCPARREWEVGVSIRINVPATMIECPPPPPPPTWTICRTPRGSSPSKLLRLWLHLATRSQGISLYPPQNAWRSAPDRSCGCQQLAVKLAKARPLCLPGHSGQQ